MATRNEYLWKMSNPTENTPLTAPAAKAIVRPAFTGPAGSSVLAAAKKIADEEWMSPMQVIISALIGGVILALVYYYTVTTLLQVSSTTTNPTNGIFTTDNWLTIGKGGLFFLILAVLLTTAGSTVGMSWKKNGDAALWSIGATILTGVLYYFVFASARDGRKDQFAFWSFLATIVSIAIPAYGWWVTRALVKDTETSPSSYPTTYNEGKETEISRIKSRGTWSMITLGISVVFSLIVASGLYKIYSVMPTGSWPQ